MRGRKVDILLSAPNLHQQFIRAQAKKNRGEAMKIDNTVGWVEERNPTHPESPKMP